MVYRVLISPRAFPAVEANILNSTEKFSIRAQSYLVGHYSGLKRDVGAESTTREVPNFIDSAPQRNGVTMKVLDD